MHLTIRADGGSDIGYGHLVRTTALAREAHSRGHTVTYATTTPSAVRDVCSVPIETVTLPVRDDPSPFVDWIRRTNPDVAYTDAYPVDTNYQCAVREQIPLVVAQDDARHTICADAFVNGNLYANELTYDYVEPEPVWHLGPEYLLLRDEVARLAKETPPWRETVSEVLITMGGSDIRGMTPTAMCALDGLEANLTVVIGPGFSNGNEIRRMASDVEICCSVVETPPNLLELMFDADLAITACGSTVYELLALGTPAVAVVQAANQRHIASVLNDKNLATVLPFDTSVADIRAAVFDLLDNPVQRRRYRENGQNIVPATGSKNVCDVVISTSEQSFL
ncbi:UDP-2,4-diacetamido-2,4,6-trideoxy-beta-L-altropyranose hydrolase [Salinirarus marinus]|uniref:UDP-2,4-diacetamido-2,4, 6-trideoxy-beta-L-altropyranose hydrolase n=2 Tax=Haloferacaceae TaxID=1644056 RepID=UPI003C6C8676